MTADSPTAHPMPATTATPADWADVARRRHAVYARLCAEYEQDCTPFGPPPPALVVYVRLCAEMVPHLVASIDALYADLRAAHRQTVMLGKQLVEQAASHADTALRGSGAEAWLKAACDEHPREVGAWRVLDSLLDDYRLHSDTGTPLSAEGAEEPYAPGGPR